MDEILELENISKRYRCGMKICPALSIRVCSYLMRLRFILTDFLCRVDVLSQIEIGLEL